MRLAGRFQCPELRSTATGSHCDADCAEGQGCNADDCGTIAYVVTTGIGEEGRWADGAFSLSTSENSAAAFNAAAASLTDSTMDMLQATCESVGVLATCAGHDHESLCGMLPNATAAAGR